MNRLHAVVDHAFEQIQPADDILAEIEKRPLHRLAHQRVRSEVHHGIGPMLGQGRIDRRPREQIPFDKRGLRMHRRAMPLRQIVEHDNRLAVGHQPLDDNAPNITRSAGDEDFHRMP